MGENIYKWYDLQKVNMQKIKPADSTQYQQTNNQITKWAEELNRNFTKDELQMENKSMIVYSILLVIRKL